jgi:hypothetical protein
MKKLISVFLGLVALSLLAMPLAACEGEVSFTTASLSEATMCLGVDDDKHPLDATDVFPPDVPEIFCSVKLSSAPPGTEFRAEWIYVGGELENVSDYLIDVWETTVEEACYIEVSLERGEVEWPRGYYQLVMYINDKEELSVPFTVE